jgi:membrane-associated phospholipid phosphatase
MHPACKYLLCSGVFLLCLNGTAHADNFQPSPYPEILADDAKYILTSPTRWHSPEWGSLGLSIVGVLGVGVIADRPIRDEMRRHTPNNNGFMLSVERFGAEYAALTVGGFYLAGAMGNTTSAAVAQDGLTASLIASGIVTPTIKLVIGRARPRENVGIAKFHPFSLAYSSNSSFPSGHTTEAFALASVIATHYEETWVSCASYSIAGLVGIARSYHDAHFASDVLVGALIGTLIGKGVVAHNEPSRSRKVLLLPEITPDMTGVRLLSSF